MLALVIIFVVFLFKEGSNAEDGPSCEAQNKYEWSHRGTKNGPSTWKKNFERCGWHDQSPLDVWIPRGKGSLPKLVYNNFDKPMTKATVENKGWSVVITPKDGVERFIKREGSRRNYTLDEIRFHFPSEHTIDSVGYSMEVQMLTHQSDYKTNVFALASMLRLVNDATDGWKPISDILPNILYRGDSTDLQTQLDLAALLPKNTASYYDYGGTNTVPPCESRYTWLVLKDIGGIDKPTLKAFNSLYGVEKADASDSCLMGPSNRPLQSFDGRVIESSG